MEAKLAAAGGHLCVQSFKSQPPNCEASVYVIELTSLEPCLAACTSAFSPSTSSFQRPKWPDTLSNNNLRKEQS